MIYAGILAGGLGSRMGQGTPPKQFMMLKGRPMITVAAEAFVDIEEIDRIIIPCPEAWMQRMREVIGEYCADPEKIDVIPGGNDRNDSIIKVIEHMEATYGISESDILITHDGARPLVTERIIRDNIAMARSGKACTTAVAATDTVFLSSDGLVMTGVMDRSTCYMTQTPQTFSPLRFRQIYDTLSEEERAGLTDAARVFFEAGEEVMIVEGDRNNIKITYAEDMSGAENILQTAEDRRL